MIILRTWLLYAWRCREAIIWITALVLLAFSDPASHHHTLCPFNNLGITFCPGCGIGRSITCLFHGMFIESFKLHPLGGAAVLLLLHRSYKVFRNNIDTIKSKKLLNYG